jgi:hypothetical protein
MHAKYKLGNQSGRRPLGKPKGGWEGSIQNNLGEISLEVVKWVHLAWDRFQRLTFVNKAMCLHILSSWTHIAFEGNPPFNLCDVNFQE